jgi:hypothetical protein
VHSCVDVRLLCARSVCTLNPQLSVCSVCNLNPQPRDIKVHSCVDVRLLCAVCAVMMQICGMCSPYCFLEAQRWIQALTPPTPDTPLHSHTCFAHLSQTLITAFMVSTGFVQWPKDSLLDANYYMSVAFFSLLQM